jgi:pyruvate dehydrogenase E2 component (dihydrolipoamide acetyltransferase)
MDDAMKSRAIINNIPDTKVSFNDMVIKACAMAKKHPKLTLNGRKKQLQSTIMLILVCCSCRRWFSCSCIKVYRCMSLSQIGGSVRDLAGRAKKKIITEMEGSTFTVSNLGMFGIVEFNSINQPNSAILSVGAIVEKPVVKTAKLL